MIVQVAAGGPEAATKREKRVRKAARLPAGTLVPVTVTSVHAAHVAVVLENGALTLYCFTCILSALCSNGPFPEA
jgi:hypothetical protein